MISNASPLREPLGCQNENYGNTFDTEQKKKNDFCPNAIIIIKKSIWQTMPHTRTYS